MSDAFVKKIEKQVQPKLDTCGLYEFLERYNPEELFKELNTASTQGTVLSFVQNNSTSATALFLLLRKGANPNLIQKQEGPDGWVLGTLLDEISNEVSNPCQTLGTSFEEVSFEDPKARFNIADRQTMLKAFGAKTIDELNSGSRF